MTSDIISSLVRSATAAAAASLASTSTTHPTASLSVDNDNDFQLSSLIGRTRQVFRRPAVTDLTTDARRLKRGRKKVQFWKASVCLLRRATVDFFPSSEELKFLNDNGFGLRKVNLDRYAAIGTLGDTLQNVYDRVPLNLVGFKVARCAKTKVVTEIVQPTSILNLEKEIGRGKLIIIPLRDLPMPVQQQHVVGANDTSLIRPNVAHTASTSLDTLDRNEMVRSIRHAAPTSHALNFDELLDIEMDFNEDYVFQASPQARIQHEDERLHSELIATRAQLEERLRRLRNVASIETIAVQSGTAPGLNGSGIEPPVSTSMDNILRPTVPPLMTTTMEVIPSTTSTSTTTTTNSGPRLDISVSNSRFNVFGHIPREPDLQQRDTSDDEATLPDKPETLETMTVTAELGPASVTSPSNLQSRGRGVRRAAQVARATISVAASTIRNARQRPPLPVDVDLTIGTVNSTTREPSTAELGPASHATPQFPSQDLIVIDDERYQQGNVIGAEHECLFTAIGEFYDNLSVAELTVKRQSVLTDLLKFYSSSESLNYRLKVSFEGETGDDFGGLTKEMFTAFWTEAYQQFFHGENCKVPFLPLYRQRKESNAFVAIGRVMSHMAGLTRSLPCQIARSTFISLVFSEPADEECLLGDLLLFVTEGERQLLRLALADFSKLSVEQIDAIGAFFVHNELNEMPKRDEIRQQLSAIAANLLITKTEPFIKLMRSGLPQVHIDLFWSHMTTDKLTVYIESQRPTAMRVAAALKPSEEDLHPEQARVFYYLKHFVECLGGEDLQLFLQFVTGSFHMPPSDIIVSFFGSSATARHVVAHTCSNSIEISTAYSSVQEFRREMLLMLHNENSMQFSLL